MGSPAEDAAGDTLLSRSGSTGSNGKLTCRLDIPISQELEEAVITLASVSRMPKAEYVRKVLERVLFGELPMVQRMHDGMRPGPWEESR